MKERDCRKSRAFPHSAAAEPRSEMRGRSIRGFMLPAAGRAAGTFGVMRRKGEFNLQVQQLNSFSLQRSEMFIATNARPKISLR
jgi:hypothetical protein